MNSKLVATLVICGTLCALAPIALAYYLIKQLSPMVKEVHRIDDGMMLLVSVAGCPGVLVFLVGVFLLLVALKRAQATGEPAAKP
jgi:integral membrane sensor domain MASE1